jgi:hypothetical protein
VAADFTELVDSLADRPTRLYELVPTMPSHVGACDACQAGMGGVLWLSTTDGQPPIVWRQRFAPPVSRALITADSRSGTLSISDLELAGIIAHKDVLVHAHDVRERTLWIASDNRAAISWSEKGSATSRAARAYLLQFTAVHQRRHRYLARHHYIPGPVNAMADDASRLWALSDAQLLTHFNVHYPQDRSWTLHHLPSATNTALTGALFRRRPPTGFLGNARPPPTPVGASGTPSAADSSSTRELSDFTTPFPSSSCSRNATAPDRSLPAVTLSALGQWKTPYERWVRRTPGWGPLTLA